MQLSFVPLSCECCLQTWFECFSRHSLLLTSSRSSQQSPQRDHGKSGGGPEESVGEGYVTLVVVLSWVSGLRTAGVRIPHPILGLTTLVNVSLERFRGL